MGGDIPFAFNGVSFPIPENWEFMGYGQRYVLLGLDKRPVMEIKWAPIKGSFSFAKHMKRVRRSVASKAITLTEKESPEEWGEALEGYNFRCFSWQGPDDSGLGLIIFCPACSTAAIVQFHTGKGLLKKELITRLLAGYRDHFKDGWRPWAVYDFAAKSPPGFSLVKAVFNPGRYVLELARRDESLVLTRLAPSSVILAGGGLLAWSWKWFEKEIKEYRLSARDGFFGDDSLLLVQEQEPGFGARVGAVLRKGTSRAAIHIHHQPEANRLYTVFWSGRRHANTKEIKEVALSCGTL